MTLNSTSEIQKFDRKPERKRLNRRLRHRWAILKWIF
jgi:hypothetical protein